MLSSEQMTTRMQSADHARRIWFGAASAVVLGVSLLLAYVPVQVPLCLFKTVFHLPCPTCGMTRSLIALWHGDPVLSFRYHPLGAPTMALCIALACAPLLRRHDGRDEASRFDG